MGFKYLLREVMPPFIWKAISSLIKGRKNSHSLISYYCPCCKARVENFIPFPMINLQRLFDVQAVDAVFNAETLNISQYTCPECGATDRDRLYTLYLDMLFNELNGYVSMLEIAPSKPLADFIKSKSYISYRSADLYMEEVDDKIDITNMDIYEDEKFDVIICSHVLEHVENDMKAISELYRVLKQRGYAILMVPITLGFKDIKEDNHIKKNPQLCLKYYGQEDHIRRYSKEGYIMRLEEGGFIVSEYGENDFGSDLFLQAGIHKRSVLYVVTKV
ncbi:class I SAM-dependent methyltransferase [Amphritea balenae]|nr:class I SAM-dependent methyltransferase [Amphritea balenae]